MANDCVGTWERFQYTSDITHQSSPVGKLEIIAGGGPDDFTGHYFPDPQHPGVSIPLRGICRPDAGTPAPVHFMNFRIEMNGLVYFFRGVKPTSVLDIAGGTYMAFDPNAPLAQSEASVLLQPDPGDTGGWGGTVTLLKQPDEGERGSKRSSG